MRLAVVLACCIYFLAAAQAKAETPSTTQFDPFQAYTSDYAKQSAIQSLPLDKLDAQGRAKVHAVLANLTVFRRLPVRVIDCDPDLYLFLVRHPDVIVNIWNALKLSQLQLQQTGSDSLRLKEPSGITADLEYLYRSHNTHLVYAEGVYDGVMFPQSVKGNALFLLKTGYIRETDGRYYISTRLDTFISIEPGAVELVTKAIHPLFGKTADNNFSQTVAFVGSLSHTTEMNPRKVQRLALRLNIVQPEVRNEFSNLAEKISQKPSAIALREVVDSVNVARKDNNSVKR
ncbi:MAG TPA: hypothetical protein VIH42_09715 [Thermoguttaceae bacterium]